MNAVLPLELSAAARTALENALGPERVLTRWLDRVALASDASFYHLIPQAVVRPQHLEHVRALFAWSQAQRIPLTFRAGGTSLSGQAITDGVLVDLARDWREVEVREEGRLIRAQPGVVGAHLNALLRPWGRKIGPDPASIQACMLGGILANNASGMCCGVAHNAYHTLERLRVMLPSGQVFDSGSASEAARFRRECPELAAELLAIRAELAADPVLSARIRRKYRLKNTTGYALNAFLDHAEPLEIYAHLLIGSEGTLGFIAEAELQTLPDAPHKLTGLLFFANPVVACEQIAQLSDAAAIELMDAASLATVHPELLARWLPGPLPASACALLVEYHGSQPLDPAAYLTALQGLPVLVPAQLSAVPAEQAALWKIRKGLYPSVGAARASGRSVLIEDVAVPVAHLAEAIAALQALFQRHGYTEAIIFGHARDGNLHFVLTPSFQTAAETVRYADFMAELVSLVLGFEGALKAEHGTGRNMAPFVEAEWGGTALKLMQRLKRAVDPDFLLNPGVILNPDPEAHIQHLKRLPSIDPEVDRCTECGFCEPVCPSRRVTLTPRQRIVLRRERARLQASGQQDTLLQLERDYQYAGLDTCAADSLCSLACPIGIDTGALVKRLRSEQIAPPLQRQVKRLSKSFQQLETGMRLALSAGHLADRVLGERALKALVGGLGRLAKLRLPAWDHRLPPAQMRRLPLSAPEGAAFVYFPSCLSRNLGYRDADDLPHTLMALAGRAGVPVWLPQESKGLCCGLPFGSKGFADAGQQQAERTLARFWAWSRHGQLPVVVDTSPCTQQLVQLAREHYPQLQILDAVQFAEHTLAPRLPVRQGEGEVVLHPVCSLRKLGLEGDLQALAQRCSTQVRVPLGSGCCGFAGDRGLLFPELPAAALADVAAELAPLGPATYCSSSRSCEMGLTLALDRPYVSILHLLAASLEEA
ncbi:MAG: FAD-binding and (Fe-S)-binding domain-containing protein [Candidatus Sericytochromatia bacterium]